MNDLNKNGATALQIACEKDHTKVASSLLLGDRATALQIACEKGHTKVASSLLLGDRATALQIACEKGHTKVASFLLDDRSKKATAENNSDENGAGAHINSSQSFFKPNTGEVEMTINASTPQSS
jgi:ankyrin repeat protein